MGFVPPPSDREGFRRWLRDRRRERLLSGFAIIFAVVVLGGTAIAWRLMNW